MSEQGNEPNWALQQHFTALLTWREYEVFAAAFFDEHQRLLSVTPMFRGGANRVQVDIAAVFAEACRLNARRIVVAHNHPFSSPSPSEQDARLLRRLLLAGAMVGITVDDSLIVSQEGVYSMRKDGPWLVPLDEYMTFIHDSSPDCVSFVSPTPQTI